MGVLNNLAVFVGCLNGATNLSNHLLFVTSFSRDKQKRVRSLEQIIPIFQAQIGPGRNFKVPFSLLV